VHSESAAVTTLIPFNHLRKNVIWQDLKIKNLISGSCNRGAEDNATRGCDASAAGAILNFFKVVHKFVPYRTLNVGTQTLTGYIKCKILLVNSYVCRVALCEATECPLLSYWSRFPGLFQADLELMVAVGMNLMLLNLASFYSFEYADFSFSTYGIFY
jgi:hypothetical protein